jgi:spermidine synthase
MAFILVIVLFFFSGFSSLIYQVVWTRMLVFVFGSTTFATSTVLAVFMGGLALGAYIAGRLSDRIKKPFLLYGILEGIIALCALLVPFMFESAIPLYKLIWQYFHLSVIPFSLLRFIVVALILLIPTTCMGATLPILAKFITANLSSVGNRVGTLYAINTLGAVVGTLVAGFYLLPVYGLKMATLLAAISNILLFAIVFCTYKKVENKFVREEMDDDSLLETNKSLPQIILVAMLSFAVSGAVAMVYEVGWTRTLLMVIGSSTYAFTVMLSTFLIGIFLGSFISAKFVDRLKDPIFWFAIIELALCLAGFIAMNQCNYLPFLNLIVNAQMLNNPNGAIIVRFLLAAMILLPITLGLGAIFPIVVKIYATNLKTIGRSIGDLYTANTVGAIVGAFLAGFVMIPLWGAEHTLVLSAAINLMLGILLLMFAKSIRKSLKIFSAFAGFSVFVWAIVSGQVWDPIVMLSAQKERRWQIVEPSSIANFGSYREWQNALHTTSKLLFWKDGACSTVGVIGYPDTKTRALLTNGHVDASDQMDMYTQVLLSAYPLLFKPDASDVAVIGWGSGVTIGVASCFPVKSIIGIEIEPAVIEAAKYFSHVNEMPDKNPLVIKEFNDGRNYLLATDKTFDLIVSEPSNPWQAGVCNLFTQEFFSICSKRLKKDGIFSLWLQLSEIPPDNVRGVLAALHNVFPNVVSILSDEGNSIVLASNQPIKLDYDRAQELCKRPSISKYLAKAGIDNADDLLAQVALSADSTDKIVAGIKANSDDRNKLEYEVGKTYENRLFLDENFSLLNKYGNNLWDVVNWLHVSASEKAKIMRQVATSAAKAKHYDNAIKWAKASMKIEKHPEAYRICGISEIEKGNYNQGMKLFEWALNLSPKNADVFQTIGMVQLGRNEMEAARQSFLSVLSIEPNNLAAHFHLAQAYMIPINDIHSGKEKLAMANTAVKHLSLVLPKKKFVSKHPEVLYFLGTAYRILGDNEKARDALEKYTQIKPMDALALRQLGVVLYNLGLETEASSCWNQSFQIGVRQSNKLVNKSKKLLQKRKVEEALKELAISLDLFPSNNEALSLLQTIAKRDPVYGERAKEILLKIKMPFIDKN